MSERLLRRLVLAIAVLGGLYGVTQLLSYATRPRAADGGELGAALERLNADTLVGASILSPDGKHVELKRSGGQWTVNGFAADSNAIASATSAVSTARVVDLVARNAQSHAQLGVSNDSAWSVELRGAGGNLRMLVGREGRNYTNTYVRAPDDDNVFEVGGRLRYAFARPLADWRDKVLTRVDTAAVRTLVVTRGRTDYRAERGESEWRVPGVSGTVDQTRVAEILGELRRFDATSIAPDSVTFDGSDRRRIVALGESGDTLAVLDLVGTDGTWRVRTRGDSTIYEASSWRADRLTPERGDVVKK